MGDDTTETAAARLRLLTTEFTTIPRGARPAAPPTRPTHPAAPIDLGMLDYIRQQIHEVITHTRTAAPDAGPAPADNCGVYEWMRDHTAHLDRERRRVRDAMVARHALQHAIAMGDTKAVRKITCPRCHCWSLIWQSQRELAACVNRRCVHQGRPSVWTLAALAEHQVDLRERAQATAT